MAPTNIFSFVQSRQYGGPRTRLWEAQLTVLRMRERWSFARASPRGSRSVKDIVLLSRDAFCLVHSGGRADAFMSRVVSGERQMDWLTGLSIFDGERIKMVSHLRASQALLTVFAISGRGFQGKLFVRVLEVPPIFHGELRTRRCGSLSEVEVAAGGFIEFDDQNQCVWANDGQTLRCWDAGTFERRFALGPWLPQEVPNLRFTRGLAGLMRPLQTGAVEIGLHSAESGELLALQEVELRPQSTDLVFLEMVNDLALMKRRGCEVVVVSLRGAGHHVLAGTAAWEPELFVFLPSRRLLLALFAESIEIWRCLRPDGCFKIGMVQQTEGFGPQRFSIDERLGAALVVRPPDDGLRSGAAKAQASSRASSGAPRWSPRLAALREADETAVGNSSGADLSLIDLLRFGGTRAALQGACEGAGGGGVERVIFDIAQGLLILLGRNGGLFAYTAGFN